MMEERNNQSTPDASKQSALQPVVDTLASVDSDARNQVALSMLDRINEVQAQLGTDGARYKQVPEIPQEVQEVLFGRQILMVDDMGFNLSDWMAVLVPATDGSCSFILHTDQSRSELVQQIVARQPEVVLLDYSLAQEIQGTELVPALRRELPECIIIGFSSDRSYNQIFARSGVDGIADKGKCDAATLQVLCEHISNFLAREGTPESWQKIGCTAERSQQSAIEAAFNRQLGQECVSEVIAKVSSHILLRSDIAEAEGLTEAERRQIGSERFSQILVEACKQYESPFRQFLAALSDEEYYNPIVRETMRPDGDYYDVIFQQLDRLVTLLPETIRPVTSAAELIGSAVNQNGQFALLLNTERDVRYIITNEEYIELNDVCGYKYLDVAPDGSPFIRCRTHQGGGRAFFDGERLMAHKFFQTCAPRVDFFAGGYIVNSTNCSIVNGMLYPLLNEADRVAITTGAHADIEFGLTDDGKLGVRTRITCDFSTKEALESYEKNREMAGKLVVDERGVIHLDDRVIEPLGRFLPSKVTIQPNGFAHYEWSEFEWLR